MKTQQARDLADQIASLLRAERPKQAYTQLVPILSQRTPFRLLDVIGQAVGKNQLSVRDPF